jgi:hypothetical protein
MIVTTAEQRDAAAAAPRGNRREVLAVFLRLGLPYDAEIRHGALASFR